MEVDPMANGHRITWREESELRAVGSCLLVLEGYSQDEDFLAYRMLMRREGRDLLSFRQDSFELDTTRSHERNILFELLWLSQNTTSVIAREFEGLRKRMDEQKVMKLMGQSEIHTSFETLENWIQELIDCEVVESIECD